MKRTIKLAGALLCILASAQAFAQQAPAFSQYFFNAVTVNPAYAGSREAMNFTVISREQWIGADGRPRSSTFSMHSPTKGEKMAFGLSFATDRVGIVNTGSLYGDFNYRVKINETTRLAMGVKAGFDAMNVDLVSVAGVEGDPAFSENVINANLANVGVGFYLWNEKYYVGISAPKLIENQIRRDSKDIPAGQQIRQYYLNAGYVFDIAERLKLKPTLMASYAAGVAPRAEATLNLLLADKLWVGGMYRYDDAVGGKISFQFTDQLRAGYAYDHYLNSFSSMSMGTHEVMLSYDLVFKKDNFFSPRHF